MGKEQDVTKSIHPRACVTLHNAILTSCCKILTSVWKRSQFLIFDRAITLTARLYPVSICVQAVTSPYVPLPNCCTGEKNDLVCWIVGL